MNFFFNLLVLTSWRQYLNSINIRYDHIYEFGVHSGKSMIELRKLLHPSKLFGFDSFQGLPETSEININDWSRGRYASDRRNFLSKFKEFEFISGWYNESLTDSIVKEFQMQNASYIDIDCDLYESAIDALDFMFRNKLAVEGTLIGYDDFWVIPCVNESLHPLSVGEGLAHKKIAQKYIVEFECVNNACSEMPSGWGPIFRVKSIGQQINLGWHPTRNCGHELQYKKLINENPRLFSINK